MSKLFLSSNQKIPTLRVMRGFTLLELIITIAIAAILLALAVPSFTSFLNANQVTTQANELLATFQVARMESIKRSARVVVCATGDANAATPSCASSSTWADAAQSNDGWISFVDANANNDYNAGERLLQVNAVSGVNATSSSNVTNGVVIFRPDGMARTTTGTLLEGKIAVCIATTTPADNARDVIFALGGGRLSVAKRNGGGACAAPSNT